jgi:dienelactone hydrolase
MPLPEYLHRNLSAQNMFAALARQHTPEYSHAATQPADFSAWKNKVWPQVLETLGDWPERVEPNAELLAEFLHDGLLKQRWIIDVGPHASVIFQINYPENFNLKSGEKKPAILCWHGHGQHGKEPVMGNDSSPHYRAAMEDHNYNYGHQMAKNGFITFAIDWMNCGDRLEAGKGNGNHQNGGRDWCNLYYLHATMLGMTPLSINVQHGKASTDFACSLPGVDADRLGVMGLSGGGTMTTWSALCDERFKAAEIICYSGLWALFGMRDTNYCGMQVAPGLYQLVDLPDLQGLIAPRPLLIDIGAYDDCFKSEDALSCFAQLEKIYEAAGARDNLELDLFPNNHAWGGNKSVAFFGKYL